MNAKMNCIMVVCCHDEWHNFSADTLLERLLARMKQVLFVDHRVVCTNVDRLVPLIRKAGFHHAPLGLAASRQGHDLPSDFKRSLSRELRQLIGSVGNVQLTVDAAHLLVKTATVEEMFDQLMENGDCHEIALAHVIDPHLFLKNGDALMQIFDHAQVDRQKMPELYRRAGVAIRHGLRPQLGPKIMEFLPVSWVEAMAYSPQYHEFFDEQSAGME